MMHAISKNSNSNLQFMHKTLMLYGSYCQVINPTSKTTLVLTYTATGIYLTEINETIHTTLFK